MMIAFTGTTSTDDDKVYWLQNLSRRRVTKLEQTLVHWRARIRSKPDKDSANAVPITLRKRRENVKSGDNWKLFYYK